MADFIGEANLTVGVFRREPDGVNFECDGMTIAFGTVDLPEGAKVLDLRPDRVSIVPSSEKGPIYVTRRAFVGASFAYILSIHWGQMLVIRPSSE